jgi:hypothetical protein
MGVGFYDRFLNGVGIMKFLVGMRIPEMSFESNIMTATPHLSDISMISCNTGTAFNFVALGLFIIVSVFIISIIAGTLGRGGMS